MFFARQLESAARCSHVNIVHVRSKLLYYLQYFKQNDMSGCYWVCTSTSGVQVLQHYLLSDLKGPLSFFFFFFLISSSQCYWVLVFVCFPFCTICSIRILIAQTSLLTLCVENSWEDPIFSLFFYFLLDHWAQQV